MESCMGKFAKYFLFLYNLLFLLSGAGILGIGIWIRVGEYFAPLEELLNVAAVGNYLYAAASILIGFGSFVFLVGLLGCFGAVTENKILLGMYITFLVLIYLGELGGGIIGFGYTNYVFDDLQWGLRPTFDKYEPATNTTKENALALAWDNVQVWFQCCGAYSYTDYRMVIFSQPDVYVPKTCCVLVNSDPSDPHPLNMTGCQEAASTHHNIHSDYLRTKNCFVSVEVKLKGYRGIFIGVGLGIAFLQSLDIVLACCVCQDAKREYTKFQ